MTYFNLIVLKRFVLDYNGFLLNAGLNIHLNFHLPIQIMM